MQPIEYVSLAKGLRRRGSAYDHRIATVDGKSRKSRRDNIPNQCRLASLRLSMDLEILPCSRLIKQVRNLQFRFMNQGLQKLLIISV